MCPPSHILGNRCPKLCPRWHKWTENSSLTWMLTAKTVMTHIYDNGHFVNGSQLRVIPHLRTICQSFECWTVIQLFFWLFLWLEEDRRFSVEMWHGDNCDETNWHLHPSLTLLHSQCIKPRLHDIFRLGRERILTPYQHKKLCTTFKSCPSLIVILSNNIF